MKKSDKSVVALCETTEVVGNGDIRYFNDERPIARRGRKLWVDFVRVERPNKWTPTKHSRVQEYV